MAGYFSILCSQRMVDRVPGVRHAGGESLPVCASPAIRVGAGPAVRCSYKFLLRPTRKQEAALGACLEDTRQLYNAALEERREAWRMGRRQVTFYSQDAQLKEIRAENPERYEHWSFNCERAVIRRLDRAFQGFYRRVKAGEKPGYPRILSCDVPAQPLEPTGSLVGVDMGVASFLATSDGKQTPNPRHLAASAERLAAAQRDLARKKRGSQRRKKAAAKVVGLHGKVRRQRLDHAHSTALALVRAYDLIVHEDLKIANMTARPRPRPDGDGGYQPNGAAAKARLNKSINDAGWGIFLRVLAAKAESAGRTVIAVSPRHTSQRCAECGHTAAGNRVTQAEFRCLACGHHAHADVNAARNILRAGLALQEAKRRPEKPLGRAEESREPAIPPPGPGPRPCRAQACPMRKF
jgi:putative transposase